MKKMIIIFGIIFGVGLVSAITLSDIIGNYAIFYDNVSIGNGTTTILMNGSNGNISTVGNISSSGVICDSNGCISAGSSFVYDDYFDQYLNTTNNVTFNKIGLGGVTDPSYALDYSGTLAGQSVANFNVNASTGISSALRFDMSVPSTSVSSGTIGAIGFYTILSEKKDRSGTSLIEGIRTEIGANSVVQTGGTTNIKGSNVVVTHKQNTGGTQNIYGSYIDVGQPLVLSGNPIYNLYGNYVTGSSGIDVASGTINRYGYYVTGFNKGGMEDSVYGFYSPDSGIRVADYYSGDGTQGMTGTCTLASITTITVKDGLITGCS